MFTARSAGTLGECISGGILGAKRWERYLSSIFSSIAGAKRRGKSFGRYFWGTKWDPEVHLEFTDNGDGTAEITGWFDTAWAPPIEAFQSLADDWDSCYIELFYEESGMCFVGCWDSEGGDDYYEYADADSKTITDIVPAYLVDHFALDERLAEYEAEEEEMLDV